MEIVPVGQKQVLAVRGVKSDIIKIAEDAQTEASAELLAAFRQMLNKPAFSDVVFVCNDGKRVQASRIILAGRSDVLKSMFMNGMAESHLFEIPLALISSPALRSVLEFLYTGTLSDHIPQSWTMACEVVSASRFFLLPNLEKITRKFMHAHTVRVAKDLSKAATLLTEAVGFKTMREELDVNLRDLVTILSSDWSQKYFVRNLSEDAFRYLLANSKGRADGKRSPDWKPVPLKEYLKFRQVLRWWVNQSDFDSVTAEKVVSRIVPDKENALSMCEHPDFYNFFGDSGCPSYHQRPEWTGIWSSLKLNNELRESVITLLSNIDYHKIHPLLLTRFVEPLKLVSSGEILNALRYHALRMHFVSKTNECVWQHGKSYTELEQGYVLKKTGPEIGLAVAMAEIGRSCYVYQWSFFVEKRSETFCELGFMYYEPDFEIRLQRELYPTVYGQRLSDHHTARLLKIQGGLVDVNWEGDPGEQVHWKTLVEKYFINSETRILFTYDPLECTCSLAIGDKYCGVVWKNLPSEIYFPAVSLGDSSKGRVRIELGSGFDIRSNY